MYVTYNFILYNAMILVMVKIFQMLHNNNEKTRLSVISI